MKAALAALAALLLSVSVAAQGEYAWRETTGSPRPFGRQRHQMVFDASQQAVVLFGGFNGSYLNDWWAYDAQGWRVISAAHLPPGRADHAMAWDPVRGRVVVIGGTDGTPFDDTWEWDGTDWAQVATGVRGLGAGGSACYDPRLGGVFYSDGSVNMLWDGTTWRTLNVRTPNGPNGNHVVYDAATGASIALAGQNLFRFDSRDGWTSISTSGLLSLNDYAFAIDPTRQRPILQGGQGSVGNGSSNGQMATFIWNGLSWSETALGPWPGRARHAMVYDPSRDLFVMFGGDENSSREYLDDTWELYDRGPAADYRTFGQGCSGTSSYLPDMRPEPLFNSAPVLGGTFTMRIDGLPPGQPASVAVGWSDTQWGTTPLPLALDSLGMQGCALYIAPSTFEPAGLANASGWTWWTVRIPNDEGLRGSGFFLQALVLAPGANAIGVLTSNAGRGTIGHR